MNPQIEACIVGMQDAARESLPADGVADKLDHVLSLAVIFALRLVGRQPSKPIVVPDGRCQRCNKMRPNHTFDRPCAPSTGIVAPVIQLARGDASITTAYATSSGRPRRPAGNS